MRWLWLARILALMVWRPMLRRLKVLRIKAGRFVFGGITALRIKLWRDLVWQHLVRQPATCRPCAWWQGSLDVARVQTKPRGFATQRRLASWPLCLLGLLVSTNLFAAAEALMPQPLKVIWVGPDAPFQQIQAALDQVNADPNLTRDGQSLGWVLIRVQAGVYREQLQLTRDQLVIAGSGMGQTIIQYPVLRQRFLANKAGLAAAELPRGAELERDWGAAVVNIKAHDIALLDLTVHNSYAIEYPTDPKRFDHQFALRGFASASRILTDHSEFLSAGGDTVALWNKQHGEYFHSHSRFVGRVDLLCPRGSAWVEHSEFVNHGAVATLWHDGELSASQALVVTDSTFYGVNGFELGRHHYDGQFVLLRNRFSAALSSQPLYRRTYPTEPWRDQPVRFGGRYWLYGNQLSPLSTDNPALHDSISADEAAAWTLARLFPHWQPRAELAQFRRWLAAPQEH